MILSSLHIRCMLACVAACMILTACGSPSARFHTLRASDSGDVASTALTPALLVDLLSVRVPPSVVGRRLVVQAGSGQVDVLETDRWASPVADEIRGALSAEVIRQAGAMDAHGLPSNGLPPIYRVTVDVQRFESWRGSHVLIDAVWSIRTAQGQQMLTCRSVTSEEVSAGTDAVVEGHRRALKKVAAQIAAGLRAIQAEPSAAAWATAGCVSSLPGGAG